MRALCPVISSVLAVLSLCSAVQAADTGFKAGDILVRGRGLAVLPSTSSSVSAIGGHVDASNTVVPEADISYFFTPHISVEAIAAVSRHHLTDKASSIGDVDLGHVTLLPPTVTLQYHFLPEEKINPYVGAGLNYTVFFDKSLAAGSAATSIRYKDTLNPAVQAGVDYHIQGNWYANLDVKHIFLSTTASVNNGAINAKVDIDPTIVGVGIGYKF